MPPKKTVADIESAKNAASEKKSVVTKYDPLNHKNDNSKRATEYNQYAKDSMSQKKVKK